MIRLRIVDFHKKIEILCARAGITPEKMYSDLKKHAEMHPGMFKKWRNLKTVQLNGGYSEKFIHYWKKHHKIDLPPIISLSIEEFEKQIDLQKESFPESLTPQERNIDKFIGTYQIIRPHTFFSNRYILETMEIKSERESTSIYMYSHNRPSIEYLYEGKTCVADRYCFSLLKRTHEADGAKHAFRCITFFAGSGASSEFVSGLMLRGVAGEYGNQAAAVPFIAVRSDENYSLTEPNFIELKKELMWRLHPKSVILVGELYENISDVLYELCDKMFKQIKAIDGALLSGNKTVLRTITSKDLKTITGLSFSSWRQSAHQYLLKVVA